MPIDICLTDIIMFLQIFARITKLLHSLYPVILFSEFQISKQSPNL